LVVTVHLHTILQRQTPDGVIGQLTVELPAGCTVAELLQRLEVPLDPDALLLVVNGRVVEPDHTLAQHDKVNLMPAISGG